MLTIKTNRPQTRPGWICLAFAVGVEARSESSEQMRFKSSRLIHSVLVALNFKCARKKTATCAWALMVMISRSAAEETNALPQKPDELRLENLLNLEVPTVESASRYSQKTTEAPASVTIITADEVKKYGYRTLADILQSVRGLEVSYNRNYSFLGIRGFNRGDFNSRILVLVDGHRINNSLSDGAFIGTEFILDVDLIEKVEVIRGPASSLYGNNALFGVVNVITRKGRDMAGHGAEVSGEAASFDTYKGRATYGHKFETGAEMLLSGSWYDSQGPENIVFRRFNPLANTNFVAHKVDDDAYRNVFGSFSFHDWSLEGAFNTREKGVPTAPFGTRISDPRTQTTDDRSFVNLKYAHEFPESVDVTAQIYYDRHDFTGDFLLDTMPETLNREKQEAQWWGVDFQVKKVLFERHVLIAGAEYRDDFIQIRRNFDVSPPSADFVNAPSDTYNYGVYLQGDAAVLTNLHVNAGFRYDQYGHTDPTVNPRSALIYSPWEKTTFKFIRGHAFRAPNYYERIFNASLIPERITTHDLVYEQGIGKHLRSSVSGFYNEIEHLIVVQGGTAQNVAGAVSRGIGLELQGFWASGMRGRMSYTLQDTEFHQAGIPRSDAPKHLGKFNLITPLLKEKVFAGLEFQYTSKRLTLNGGEASGFGVVNFTLFSQNLVKGLELSASIYNLLDRRYNDPATPLLPEDLIPRDGRTYRVKLTYRF